MNKRLIFIDTETTGNGPEDVLCQIAYKYDDAIFEALYNPNRKIPPEASAVTHITNKMVADKPVFKESEEYISVKKLLEDEDSIFIAHNARFDVGMFEKEGIIPKNVICTLRLARYLDKESKIPRYNLQYLRYFLEIEIEAQAHDALGDVLVLEQLFPRLKDSLKKEIAIEDEDLLLKKMIEISSRPSIMNTFTFGKHSGKKVADVAKVDSGYLDWLLKQKLQNEGDDEDWIYTLKHYLGK